MKKNIALVAAIASVLITGCSTIDSKVIRPLVGDSFVNEVNSNTDALATQLSATKKISYTPVVVTTLSRLPAQAQCKETALLKDLVTARLGTNSLRVSEVDTAKVVDIDAENNTVITPQGKAAAEAVSADTIVAVSWTTVPPKKLPELMEKMKLGVGDKTYVTLKALRVSDGRVLGSQVFLTPDPINCAAPR